MSKVRTGFVPFEVDSPRRICWNIRRPCTKMQCIEMCPGRTDTSMAGSAVWGLDRPTYDTDYTQCESCKIYKIYCHEIFIKTI